MLRISKLGKIYYFSLCVFTGLFTSSHSNAAETQWCSFKLYSSNIGTIDDFPKDCDCESGKEIASEISTMKSAGYEIEEKKGADGKVKTMKFHLPNSNEYGFSYRGIETCKKGLKEVQKSLKKKAEKNQKKYE